MSAADEPKILPPSPRLQNKLGKGVKLRNVIQPEKLQKAQALSEATRDEFLTLTREDLKTMQQALDDGPTPASQQALLESAFRVKSRAGMFDYSLASSICRQLYTFLERRKQLSEDDLAIITSHVNALRAVFHANITGEGGKMGEELMESLLQLLVRKEK